MVGAMVMHPFRMVRVFGITWDAPEIPSELFEECMEADWKGLTGRGCACGKLLSEGAVVEGYATPWVFIVTNKSAPNCMKIRDPW
jgi:hypothetical protein